MSSAIARTTLAVFLVVILLLSVTLTASATAAQLWYLDGQPHDPVAANNVMEKTMDTQSGWAVVDAEGSRYWLAEHAAQTHVAFPGGAWVVELSLDGNSVDGPAIANCWDVGPPWEATIGGWDTDNASEPFYPIPTTTEATISWDSSNVLIIELQADPATIWQGDFLALKIKNLDTVDHQINTDGRSSLRSPDTDPGYPLPELPTVILLGAGLVGLVGYCGLRRKKATAQV